MSVLRPYLKPYLQPYTAQYGTTYPLVGTGPWLPPGSEWLIRLPLLTDRYGLGSPDATLDRNSPSSIIDFEGLTKAILPYEFGFNDYRRVENLATGLLTQTITVSDNKVYQVCISGDAGATAVMSGAFTWTLTADGSNRISIDNGIPGSAITTSLTITVTGALTELLLEDVTGQVITAPSELVTPNDSACSDHDIPVRYFASENGNTVDGNGVVTEATGAAIPEGRGLQVWEESENLFTYSNDVTQWTPTDATINDFESFTPTATDGKALMLYGATTIGATYTASFMCKSDGNTALNFEHNNSATGQRTSFTASAVWQKFEFSYLGNASGGQIWQGVRDGNASGFGKIYVKDMQVEEKPYATPIIFTSGAAATRLADNVQTEWPSGLVNDFVITNEHTSGISGAISSNRKSWTVNTTASHSRLQISPDATVISHFAFGANFTMGTLIDTDTHILKVRKSATQGSSAWLDAIKTGASGNVGDAEMATLMFIGSEGLLSQINGNIKNINVVSGDLTDEEVYMIGNDDPWAGMSLDFQALNTEGDVEIGTGSITTVATEWDGQYLNFPIGSSASFDSANHSDDDGVWSCRMTTNQALPIIDGFLSQTATTFQLSDGTNSTNLQLISGEVELTVIYHKAEGLMALGVNGVLTADVPYDGTLLQGILDLFRGI